MTAAEAYAVQRRLVELLQADGEGDVVGYKLGLTSRAMQTQLGIDQPDYGPVLAAGVHPDGVEVDLDRLIQPKVEAEVAIVLEAPLAGPHCTALDVCRAAAGAVAAVEIIDSRVADWRIRLADTIADLASSAAIALSSRLVPLDRVDPRLAGVAMTRNGELVATGAGAAALGDPLHAVASTPSSRARARPSEAGSMPTRARSSSDDDRSSLCTRSVPMLPDPMTTHDSVMTPSLR